MRPRTVRTVGDGSTAVAAFREALNKPDFADVIFKIKLPPSDTTTNATTAITTTTSATQQQQQPQHFQQIHAHRAILAARSPVFKEMFFGGYPEARQKEVTVEDFHPTHFLTVLEWAYCGTAQMTARDVLGVLQCANYYGLDDLMGECRELAQSFIDEENVLHLLEHASSLGETSLVVQCLNFIKAHAHAVLSSPVWLTVSAECVERVLSLPAVDCEEALLFDQCMAWLETNTTLRADVARCAEGEERKRRKQKSDEMKKKIKKLKRRQQQQKKQQAAQQGKKEEDGTSLPIQEDEDEKQDKTESTTVAAAAAAAHDNDDEEESEVSSVSSTDDDEDDDDDAYDEDDEHNEIVDPTAVNNSNNKSNVESPTSGTPTTTANTTAGGASSQQQNAGASTTDAAAVAAASTATSAGKMPSGPLVKRFFRLLRLSHLSVNHLLDRIRPLMAAHPCIRPAYVSALEFLVSPGHISSATQVPRAPTVLSTVQIDVSVDFLRGWKHLCSIPQTSATGLGFNSTQLIPSNFFAEVPAHAAYLCVGEMVVGRDDAISVVAVGCVRIVRPIIGSRTPVVAEDGDICWHASQTSFGFTPKNSSESVGGWGRVSVRPASATPSARAAAGVRFLVATQQQQQLGQMAQEDGNQRHGKRFIYYK